YFETIPVLLKQKGYKSFQGGKWWEYSYQNGGFTHGMSTGWTKEDRKDGGQWFKQFMGGEGLNLGRATMEPVYEFIEEHKADPMFIWYAPELPHYPFDAPDRYYNLYKDKDMTESAKRYYANCTWFDDGVGELMRYLKSVGEFDNTLFMYVNDNGWEQRPDQEFWDDPMRSHNGGDKGKSSIYDQSFRTPIIFSWKGRIDAGKRMTELIHSADIPATILDYMEIDAPAGYFGKSYRPLLEGKPFEARKEIIGNVTTTRSFEDMMGAPTTGFWYRDADWFFRWNKTKGEQELFAQLKDPNNDTNVMAEHPEVAAEILKKIDAWKQSRMSFWSDK
ncbi:MAG: sulfatase-like hydrolase/transferase, partial [Calditrichota bacterium]